MSKAIQPFNIYVHVIERLTHWVSFARRCSCLLTPLRLLFSFADGHCRRRPGLPKEGGMEIQLLTIFLIISDISLFPSTLLFIFVKLLGLLQISSRNALSLRSMWCQHVSQSLISPMTPIVASCRLNRTYMLILAKSLTEWWPSSYSDESNGLSYCLFVETLCSNTVHVI